MKKAKLDRWEKRIRGVGLEGPWDGDTHEWLRERGIEPSGHEGSLGTVGGGNHFAEMLRVGGLADLEAARALGVRYCRELDRGGCRLTTTLRPVVLSLDGQDARLLALLKVDTVRWIERSTSKVSRASRAIRSRSGNGSVSIQSRTTTNGIVREINSASQGNAEMTGWKAA